MKIFEGRSNSKNMVFKVKKAFKRWFGPDATAKRRIELMRAE
jgi:hypothetical protein